MKLRLNLLLVQDSVKKDTKMALVSDTEKED